ncbi:MAG: hypothetical protein KY454_03555 [Actinobacteria bacterium]|nr:hypothetical protein [Actinomycetota bacterium]
MEPRVEELAAAGGHIAHKLASLHEQGQVHGAVDADHAVLGPPHAVELKEGGGACPSAAPHDDVVALGRLLLDALGASDPFRVLRLTLSGREQTGWRRYFPGRPSPSPAARLRELALEAAAATVEGPTAAEVGTRLGRLADGQPAPRLTKRVIRAGGVAVIGAAALLAWSAVRSPLEEPAVGRSEAVSAPPAPVTPAAPAPPPPATRLWPSPPMDPACPAPSAFSADVDGDGCPDTVEVADGIIRAGPRRWAVGASDDVIVLGDWNCDQIKTPALLRPATGALFVFDRWATDAEPQPGRPVRVVVGAVALEARGCGHAAVRLSDQSVVVVATAARR